MFARRCPPRNRRADSPNSGIVGLRGTCGKGKGLFGSAARRARAGSAGLRTRRGGHGEDLVTIPGLGFSSERRSIGMNVETLRVVPADRALEPRAV